MINRENTLRIFRNTVMLYLRTLFIMAVNLYATRVIFEVLGKEEFGLYGLLASVVISLSFLNAALTGASARFLAYELADADPLRLGRVFSAVKIIHWGAAVFFVLVAETVGLYLVTRMEIPAERLTAAHAVYQMGVAEAVFVLLRIPYSAAVIAHENMDFFAYIGIAEAVMKLALIVMLKWIAWDKLILFGGLHLVTAMVVTWGFAFFCRCRFAAYPFVWVREKALFKPILGFSSWNLYLNMSISLRSAGVSYVINRFFPLTVNSARTLTERVDGSITGFVSNFLTAVQPQIVKYFASGETGSMFKLVRASAKYAFWGMLFFVLPVTAEIDFILSFWLGAGQVPEFAAAFCRIVLFQSMVMIIFKPVGFAIHATGKLKRLSLTNGTLYLLVIPTAWLLYKLGLPPIAAYAADFVLVLVCQLANLFTLKSHVKYSIAGFMWRAVAPCALCMTAAAALPLLLQGLMPEGWGRFLAVGAASAVCVAAAGYVVLLDGGARAFVNAKIAGGAGKIAGIFGL